MSTSDSTLDTANSIFRLVQSTGRPDEFLGEALRAVVGSLGSRQAAIVVLTDEGLDIRASVGRIDELPASLVADVLDRDRACESGQWQAAPLVARATSGEVLLVRGGMSLEQVSTFAGVLGVALATAQTRHNLERRVNRLEAILNIAHEWGGEKETEPLLHQMAEAATRLLGADRSSIFLWDKPNKTLVARPALGVQGGELRLPDDAGVVGQVIHTGEVRKVDAGRDALQIDRQVDQKLGYQTRNLLCVPLLSSKGEILGAFETINKKQGNFSDEDLAGLIELAGHAAISIEHTQQLEGLLATNRQLVDQAAQGVRLVGNSAPIEALRSTVQRVANTELAILLLGENGTGKEVVSRMVHYHSARREQPFIAVNCAALTETLLESELFGHEKGAFTDAHEARAGKFELASGGTLFLDEIGDLSLGGQSKLLRVLEEKVVVRVGGSRPIHTDARVVAATNQNLADMVRTKKFREDLYYRLNVVTLDLPPLRERGDDVVLLAEHFLQEFCRESRRKAPKLSAAARKRLLGHSWPGNVRELRNLMERLAYLLPDDRQDRIEAEDLAFILSPATEGNSLYDSDLELTEATRRFQIEFIQHTVDRTRGNMSDAAERLGLHRSNLYRKMRQLKMRVEEE